MPDSFGARLRLQREEQHVSLATIAEQTKIKASLLDALEKDDVSHWPSGIFRRAFVRAYAHAIGLDPDVVVREFLERYPDPIEVVSTVALAERAEEAAAQADPPSRFGLLIGSMLGSLRSKRETGIAPSQPVEILSHRIEASSRAAEPVLPAPEPAAVAAPVHAPAPVVRSAPAARASFDVDFVAAAHLCTELGRVQHAGDMATLLEKAAGLVDAVGVIVWVWNRHTSALEPALAHGYSEQVLVQLPPVGRDAPNATAAAFRSGQTCIVEGGDSGNGALAAPLMTAAGCAGVLAVELPRAREQQTSVRALVTIFAAMLATGLESGQHEERRARRRA
jgi:transcriptional regulator with XRE-family HTH domain